MSLASYHCSTPRHRKSRCCSGKTHPGIGSPSLYYIAWPVLKSPSAVIFRISGAAGGRIFHSWLANRARRIRNPKSGRLISGKAATLLPGGGCSPKTASPCTGRNSISLHRFRSSASAIRLAADGAMVKHDLTIRVASGCAIDVSSDPPLRKSLLICNALVPAVTRVTQRSIFSGRSKLNYPQIFPEVTAKSFNSVRDPLCLLRTSFARQVNPPCGNSDETGHLSTSSLLSAADWPFGQTPRQHWIS